MNQGSLHTSIQMNVATLEFYHPASNSLPTNLLNRLASEFNRLSEFDEVHVIVLKCEKDRTFCAGAFLEELLAIESMEQGEQFFSGFAKVINAMRTCKKLVIGRIQGKAVGGGVGLAAACDYCIATEASSIKLSELSIGIGPFVIAPALRRKIGLSGLSELTLEPTAWKSAYWAKEKGLFAKVFESVGEMDDEVAYFANKLASYNSLALEEMKTIFWEGTDHWEDLLTERAELSGKLALSEHTKKALLKFKK